MSKFTFLSDNMNQPNSYGIGSESVELNIDCENLDDVLSAFERFLRGCGYVFDGQLAIVDDGDLSIKSVNRLLDDVREDSY